jgi:hypothetical protein
MTEINVEGAPPNKGMQKFQINRKKHTGISLG